MKPDQDCFKEVNRDVLLDIMSRLDGRTLASLASTCACLRDAARDDVLWKKLFHDTWPSTSTINTVSCKCLYTDAFPFILYDIGSGKGLREQKTYELRPLDSALSSSPCDFSSLIDIFYKGRCIFSEVVDGMTKRNDIESSSESFNRFLCYPFTLDLLGIGSSETTVHDFHQDLGIMDDNIANSLLEAFTGYNKRGDICSNIARTIRLSWIIQNKRTGRAVNISSWKPKAAHGSNPFNDEDYSICFGCIIPAEDTSLTHKFAESVIMAKCKLLIEQGCIIWNEISLVIKDIEGSHLNGEQSMKALNRALLCSRSINRGKVEKGYRHFQNQKIQHKFKIEQEETIANLLCATVAIASLLGICYACATLL